MVGLGVANKIIVRRIKFAGPDLIIDAEVTGYTV